MITQGLFVDFAYDETFAQYTISKEDKEYNGKMYPSLYKLYMDTADPTEYRFAMEHLLGWDHWQRICANKILSEKLDIESWREELEVKLRSQAMKEVISIAKNGNFNAAKWLSDKGWDTKRGRPSNEERKKESAIKKKIAQSIEDDSNRVVEFVRK